MEKVASKRGGMPAMIIIPSECGDKKVPITRINYIDIEQRSLCFHLTLGNVTARCLLRTSFSRATEGYLQNENLLFIKPSLIINIDNIECLDKEKIIFINGDELYFPRRHYTEIYEKWAANV